MPRAPRRGAWIALALSGAVVVVLALAQLLLPGIAAQRVRSELARYGVVHGASVSAFPAIELLWGHAQAATVNAGQLSMNPAQVSELLWSARGVQRVDLHAHSMRVGSLALSDVSWRKRGDQLYTSGSLSEADLRAFLPGSTGFRLLGDGPGGVEMRVDGSLFGAPASIDVLLGAEAGKLVAQPQGVPFGSLVKVTLLAAPHMYVQTLNLTAARSTSVDPVFQVSIGARLR